MQNSLDIDKFERRDSNNLRFLSLAFDIVLYTNLPLSEAADGVLYAYDRFLKLCPKERLKWYTTENMNSHKSVTPRALNMLRDWLTPDAKKRDIIAIELKDGETYADTADYSFWVYGEERHYRSFSYRANMIRLCFPAEYANRNHAELLQLTKDLCEHFPFRSGHAGYVLQTTGYAQEKSETAAWELAIRHLGVDIKNENGDCVAIAKDGIKGVNWLTILDAELVEKIKTRPEFTQLTEDHVEVIPLSKGLLLKAGAEPAVGDVNRGANLPAYKRVYQAIAPLQAPTLDRYGSFTMPGDDYVEKTQAWMTRFA